MATSRIFVRGLPPSIGDEEFKSHFSKKRPVTDIRLMSKRRIGYVGYRTVEDAQAAIKYFHKSFLRMSKLHVEPAQGFSDTKPYGNPELHLHEKAKHQLDIDESIQPSRKRQRQPDSDLMVEGNPTHDRFDQHTTGEGIHVSSVKRLSSDSKISPVDEKRDSATGRPKPQAEDIQEHQSGGDADWMRSRTSRLLDLVDDDGDTAANQSTSCVATHSEMQTPKRTGDEEQSTHSEPAGAPYDVRPDNASIHVNGNGGARTLAESRRLFLRNLAFDVTEDNIAALLQPFGTGVEVRLPHDFQNGTSKGFAFAEFPSAESAMSAMHALDRSTFQGRLLHVLPAASKRESQHDEFTLSQLPIKRRRLVEKRQQSAAATFSWNSMFMNADAVLSSTAARLGVAKSEVIDPTSSDAAVKQAQAETSTIQATKSYFEKQGVNLESFASSKRDGRALLVKNFKFDTSPDDLRTLFAENSDLRIFKVVMPPTGTIAIIEFANEVQASIALRTFAYRKFRDSMLFLERAPRNVFTRTESTDGAAEEMKRDHTQPDAVDDEEVVADTATVFVRNLNFTTTSQRLSDEFRPLEGMRSAVVKTRPDPKGEGKMLSMGFGFLEFANKEDARAAISAMNGHVLDGHELYLKASHKGHDAAAERRQQDSNKRQKERSAKLVIKNLPFEASKKDIRNLFKSYGQLRALRMPKKLNNAARGYAFAQFKTPKEAENALNALSSTHVLGRRLVLHYAADELEDPEEQIAAMQKKVGRQVETVALQRLTASQRKKLNLDESNEAEEG